MAVYEQMMANIRHIVEKKNIVEEKNGILFN